MAGSSQRMRAALAPVRELLRVHLRTIIPAGAAVTLGILLIGFLVALYAVVLGRAAYAQLVVLATTPESASAISVLLILPIAVLAVLAGITWAGTTVQLANAAASPRRISTGGAVLVALRRAPRALLVVLVTIVALALAIVGAPLLVLVGLVGLALGQRVRRSRRSTLITMAVPFGVALAVLVRWSLALPSVWLAGTKLRAALADSAARTRGHEVRVALVLVLSAVVGFAATEGLVALVGSLGGVGYPEFVTRVIALVVVGPLLPVALALQYRRGRALPPAPAAVDARASRRARLAVAVILSLLVPFMAASNPAPAQAAGSTAVSFVIGSLDGEPLPVGTPTTIYFSVTNAVTAEGQQPTGDIAISIDGTPLTGPFTLAGNGNTYQISPTFTAGSHLIEASYPGDGMYEPKSASITLQAGTAPAPVETTTAFTLSPSSPSPAGGTVTAHVTVTANEGTATPIGTVGVYLNDQSQPPLAEGTLVGGSADIDFTLAPGGNHVVVYYTAGAGFHDSHYDDMQYVSAYASTVSVTANASSAFGETVTATATVSAGVTPTGDVDFEAIPDVGAPIDFGTATLSGGVASKDLAGLAVGDYQLVAHYLGSTAVLAGDSASFAHTVTQSGVAVAVVSSLVAPSYGDTTSLTVTVTPAAGTDVPTGTVSVTRDGTVVGSGSLFTGVAHVSVGVGAAGNHTFVATYLPALTETRFATGTGSLPLTVAPLTTTTRVIGPYTRSAHYGDSQTYSGSVFTTGGSIPTGTVELLVAGERVGAQATLAANGTFSITTDSIPVVAPFRAVTVHYLGDGNYAESTSPVDPTEAITLQLQKVTSVPVLTASDPAPTVGDTVTLTATLDDLGSGPTGTVTFTDTSTAPDTVLGSAPVVGHSASLGLVIPATAMQVVASYSGDSNFVAADSATLSVTAAMVTPTVVLAPVGNTDYGTIITLDATVTLGSLVPTSGVQFTTSSHAVLATAVPVVAGHATLQVCAGNDSDCPDTMPYLGGGPLSLFATYSATAVNYDADSAAVAYTAVPATTTTTVTINPVLVDPGAGIQLSATVAGVTSQAVPSGYVTFSASMPDGHGGFGESFIANQTLDGSGVAALMAVAGTGLSDIRWPAAAITATYVPVPSNEFAASHGSTPVTVHRFGVTLTGYAPPTVVPLAPAAVTVVLSHTPGASADYTGTVTITPDVGAGCTVSVPAGTSVTGCNLTWSTAGTHSFTATYSGDLVYESGSSLAIPVAVGTGIPNFVPQVAAHVVAGDNVDVTWNLFSAGATGTVTVWGDGTLWCTVPLADQSCTGQFLPASATGSPVEVVVRYSGDANWGPAEPHLATLVARCITPDVHSADPSMGTVQIVTASNCGAGGFLSGTVLTVTATPIIPNLFVNWQKLGGARLIPDSAVVTTTFTLTTDSTTWVRVATFSPPCYPVTAAVTGYGSLSIFPAPNCTLLGGASGYAPGTAIFAYPDPAFDSYYGEPDAFYAFQPATGVSIGLDSSQRARITATVNSALVIPVTFGPQCRAVSVLFAPASTGDASTAQTPTNCHSPQGDGYVRFTKVAVKATSGDPTLAIAGWTLNGVAQPAWGTASTQTIAIDKVVPVATVNLVHCYAIHITIDGAQDARTKPVGQVNTDTKPNCPDGSARFLGGTVVTLTPELLVKDASFTGWGPDRLNYVLPDGAAGPLPKAAKAVTMTADLAITAGFFFAPTCSKLYTYSRPQSLVTFDVGGCGPGSYFDLQKQAAIRTGEKQSSLWQSGDRTVLTATIDPNVPLDVYVSVKGDTGNCFGTPGAHGPNVNPNDWVSYGPLTRPTDDCEVGGPISIRAEACQSLITELQLQVVGDTSGASYGVGSIPANLYLPGADGTIAGFSTDGFGWTDSIPVHIDDSGVTTTAIADGACQDSGSAYPADTDIAVYAFSPADGIAFNGWTATSGRITDNPALARTTSTEAQLHLAPTYTVTCHTVTFGEGISIVGDAPYCPGSDPSDDRFIAGTAIEVKAAQHIGERSLYGFTSGIVASQVDEDPDTGDLTSYAFVDSDKKVTADYPTRGQAFTRGVAQGFKIMTGVFAVAAPIFAGLLFPPIGIMLAGLSAAAGLANLVPNGGSDVAGVFDLINPTKITQCAARWAFSNPGNPTGGKNVGAIGSTANTIRKINNGVDVSTEPVGVLGAAGAVAGLAYGLYDAGIQHADLGTQTVEQLRGTSTMTGCLDDQWHVAGSNISGG